MSKSLKEKRMRHAWNVRLDETPDHIDVSKLRLLLVLLADHADNSDRVIISDEYISYILGVSNIDPIVGYAVGKEWIDSLIEENENQSYSYYVFRIHRFI